MQRFGKNLSTNRVGLREKSRIRLGGHGEAGGKVALGMLRLSMRLATAYESHGENGRFHPFLATFGAEKDRKRL